MSNQPKAENVQRALRVQRELDAKVLKRFRADESMTVKDAYPKSGTTGGVLFAREVVSSFPTSREPAPDSRFSGAGGWGPLQPHLKWRENMNNNEITFADGTRLTTGGTWWRFDKSTSAGAVFCRGDGREIVAGRFAGGEDVPMLKVQTVDITPEAMREIGKGICRALHNALLEDLCCIAEN